ncbi:MAG: hypothetical protein ABJ363_10610 [Alphaproteobacteria bacterium]
MKLEFCTPASTAVAKSYLGTTAAFTFGIIVLIASLEGDSEATSIVFVVIGTFLYPSVELILFPFLFFFAYFRPHLAFRSRTSFVLRFMPFMLLAVIANGPLASFVFWLFSEDTLEDLFQSFSISWQTSLYAAPFSFFLLFLTLLISSHWFLCDVSKSVGSNDTGV